MQKIVPHLWFDREAAKAARFYVDTFPNSRILSDSTLGGTPSGEVEILTFNLAGSDFHAISAGPFFKFTPAVSFLVACESAREVDSLEARLRDGGSDMMPLGSYPFSERYAWVIDRFGLSWQIMAMGGRRSRQKITPTLMFVGSQCGRAEEALRHYSSLFGASTVGDIERYGPGAPPNAPDFLKHAAFTLAGHDFAAMDSALDHAFAFNEAISFMVFCDSQAEIDRYWSALSAEPEAERCGWLKDRFGLSWQIVPTALERLMSSGDEATRSRVTKAFLEMKKFDIAGLEKAAIGK